MTASRLESLRLISKAIGVVKAKAYFAAERDPLGASGLIGKINRIDAAINRCIIAEKMGLIAKSEGWQIDTYATAVETCKVILKEMEQGDY